MTMTMTATTNPYMLPADLPAYDGTREDWLNLMADCVMADILMPIAEQHGKEYPPVRFSVGYPPGRRGGKTVALGCCHPRSKSSDGHNEIFISPVCDDSMEIAHVLVHELIHAIDDNKSKHATAGFFGKCARAAGLEGPLTSTTAGHELHAQLLEYVTALGAIPMAKMIDEGKPDGSKNRNKKTYCPCCDFKFNTSATQVTRMKTNLCPVCLEGELTNDVPELALFLATLS